MMKKKSHKRLKKAQYLQPFYLLGKQPHFVFYGKTYLNEVRWYTTDTGNQDLESEVRGYTSMVSKFKVETPYKKLIIASHIFHDGFHITDLMYIVGILYILLMDIYPSIKGYVKVNIILILKKKDSIDTIAKPISRRAFPLTFEDGSLIPKCNIFDYISSCIKGLLEEYDGFFIEQIIIRAHFQDDIILPLPNKPSWDDLLSGLNDFRGSCPSHMEIDVGSLQPKILRSTNREYSRNIPQSKWGKTSLSAFLVADTETILIDDVHIPYAIGVKTVYPFNSVLYKYNEETNLTLDTFFSEDFSSELYPTFEERSTAMLKSFIFRIHNITVKSGKSSKINTIYFHNNSRFDGIFILKHLLLHHPTYKVKPLMRDNILYEISVYSSKNRLLFRFRDSLLLLPGSLDSLAKNLCPELGSKGNINHAEVRLDTLRSMKDSLLKYMIQDIILLGGIMFRFQEVYFNTYQGDIVRKLTIASLALSLFRTKYYDENKGGIHIPNKNEDSFIRRGYYGGHADAYIRKGEDLYYYDVNSLYPFIMKESLMPGGTPVWQSNLESKDLDSIYGFIEAYIECPKTIKRPFLPYKEEKSGTLIFCTGTFIGVYYSEELKYARDIGYTVIPLNGFLFEKMESPFKGYVDDLFESRSKAKKDGNKALSYVYKLLMNSLYGRFGIKPESSITEICDLSRRNILFKKEEFINEVYIKEDLYMVTYLSNVITGGGYASWSPPRFSAVQIAAAITASARIHMYPLISREDCYYTDTDSVFLGSPLPEELVSSTGLGKFKLEDQIKDAIFLAPKSYHYNPKEGGEVIKYKGAGKHHVDAEWFERQYLDPSRSLTKEVTSLFRPDWKDLNIRMNVSTTTLRTQPNTKRMFDMSKGNLKETTPIHINDLSRLNQIGRDIISNFKRKLNHLENEKSHLSQELDHLKKNKEEEETPESEAKHPEREAKHPEREAKHTEAKDDVVEGSMEKGKKSHPTYFDRVGQFKQLLLTSLRKISRRF